MNGLETLEVSLCVCVKVTNHQRDGRGLLHDPRTCTDHRTSTGRVPESHGVRARQQWLGGACYVNHSQSPSHL